MKEWAPVVVIAVFGLTPLVRATRVRRGKAAWAVWRWVLVAAASLNVAMAAFCLYQANTVPRDERLWIQPWLESIEAAHGQWWNVLFLLTPVICVFIGLLAPLKVDRTPRTVAALGRAQADGFAGRERLPVATPIDPTDGLFLLPGEPIVALCRRGLVVVAVDPGHEADGAADNEVVVYPPVLVAYIAAGWAEETVAAIKREWGTVVAIAPGDPAAPTTLQQIGADPAVVPYPPAIEHIQLPGGIVVSDQLRQSVAAATTIVAIATDVAEATQAHDTWFALAGAVESAHQVRGPRWQNH